MALSLSLKIFILPVSKLALVIRNKTYFDTCTYWDVSRCKPILVTRVHIDTCGTEQMFSWKVFKLSSVILYTIYRDTCLLTPLHFGRVKLYQLSYDTWNTVETVLWHMSKLTRVVPQKRSWRTCHSVKILLWHVSHGTNSSVRRRIRYKNACDTCPIVHNSFWQVPK